MYETGYNGSPMKITIRSTSILAGAAFAAALFSFAPLRAQQTTPAPPAQSTPSASQSAPQAAPPAAAKPATKPAPSGAASTPAQQKTPAPADTTPKPPDPEAELQQAVESANNDSAELVKNLEDYLKKFPDAPR